MFYYNEPHSFKLKQDVDGKVSASCKKKFIQQVKMQFKPYSSSIGWKGLNLTTTGITIFNSIPTGFPKREPPQALHENCIKSIAQILNEIDNNNKDSVNWWLYLLNNKIPKEVQQSSTQHLQNWSVVTVKIAQVAIEESITVITKLNEKVKKMECENCEVEV